MTPCNILLIEDNAAHRNDLDEDLTDEYGHIVKSFRDQKTFEEACQKTEVLDGFNSNHATIIILDIMMAKDLEACQPFAPRSSSLSDETDILPDNYCDDNLGINIAKAIRSGKYLALKRDIPILFFTARQASYVLEEIKSSTLQPAHYLEKPAWIDDVQTAIRDLLNQTKTI